MDKKITSILSLLKPADNNISLEVNGNKELDIDLMVQMAPPFCSVTWLDNNIADLEHHPSVSMAKCLVERNLNVISHIPGAIFNRAKLLKLLKLMKQIGLRNILAIQGEFALWRDNTERDFPLAKDLVQFIKESFGDYFCIGIVGYPDGHPRAANLQVDTEYLSHKVAAGADFMITQAIFDVNDLIRFRKRCRDYGINIPIIPGIFIIDNRAMFFRMKKLCKLAVPHDIERYLDENKDDASVAKKYGVDKAMKIVTSVMDDPSDKAYCVHIFTANNLKNVRQLRENVVNFIR